MPANTVAASSQSRRFIAGASAFFFLGAAGLAVAASVRFRGLTGPAWLAGALDGRGYPFRYRSSVSPCWNGMSAAPNGLSREMLSHARHKPMGERLGGHTH